MNLNRPPLVGLRNMHLECGLLYYAQHYERYSPEGHPLGLAGLPVPAPLLSVSVLQSVARHLSCLPRLIRWEGMLLTQVGQKRHSTEYHHESMVKALSFTRSLSMMFLTDFGLNKTPFRGQKQGMR